MIPLRFLFIVLLVGFGTLSAQHRDWIIVATYTLPEGASGLAFDGTYIYCGIYGVNGDEVYQIDPTNGSYQLLFSSSGIEDCFGMTYDENHLWITDHSGSSSTPAISYKLDMTGNILSQFNLPDHYMSGIAYDNGNFWVATYYDPDGHIYKLNSMGFILQDFPAPDNQPWDLCIENENLWMADYWGDALYKIDSNDGSLINSYESEGVDPAGIVFDGTYLWYCDNGQDYQNDFLYKVDIDEGDSQETHIVDYQSDWNLVGLLLEVENASYTTLFPESIEGTLYSFDNGYNPEISLINGEGYWLRFDNAGSSTITGVPINELTISLNAGWNLFTGITNSLNISSIQDPDGLIIPGTIYGFASDGYSNEEIIEPGKGYWIRANNSGNIILISE